MTQQAPRFNFPKTSEQVLIVGRNGSGKTQLGAWLLSHNDFNTYPVVMIDYKYDELLNSIENVREMDIKDKMPKEPGLYVVHPHPEDEDGITNFLWKIWQRENIGMYVDEGYMIHKNNPAFNAILTQGRSKHIQRIVLSQRPAFISRFAISECNHYSVFHLNDARDVKNIQSFIPAPLEKPLPRFHSRWYDVSESNIFLMQPVENRDTILERFNSKLKRKRRFF
jgi:hypothetical protein